MRHEQLRMETMAKKGGSINYHTKETIPDTKKGMFWISKQQTPGIRDTPDTTSTSTGKPDSQTKGMGNGNGQVINSTSRHRWQRQSGIEAIFSPRIEIQTRQKYTVNGARTESQKNREHPTIAYTGR